MPKTLTHEIESASASASASPTPRTSPSRIGRPAHLKDWLPPPKGPVATKVEAHEWAREALRGAETLTRERRQFEESEGIGSWDTGDLLNRMHAHSAWKALGLPGFVALARQTVRDDSWAYDLMFFARAVSRADAKWGIEKALAGLALAHLLGASGVSELWNSRKARGWSEPAGWEHRLGEKVDFANSTAERLKRLVLRLTEGALPLEGRTEHARLEASKRQQIIDRVKGRLKVLGRLEPEAYAYGSKARVRHKFPASKEEMLALAEMYRALAKG